MKYFTILKGRSYRQYHYYFHSIKRFQYNEVRYFNKIIDSSITLI